MDIHSANHKEKEAALEVARSLSDWFNNDAINNMQIDFAYNQLLVAHNKDEVVGFLCYTTYSGKCLLLWMGVQPDKHHQGIGIALLSSLELIAKELCLHTIEVETLSDTYDYQPYKRTCDFYFQQGFVSILQKPATVADHDDMMLLEKRLQE
jgi:GNAT superfamily N-acetyltransferase